MALKTNNSYLDFDIKLSGTSTYDTTTVPSNQVKIKASDGAGFDYFGYDVAVGSGRIVVGAPNVTTFGGGSNSGAIYIYDLNGTAVTTYGVQGSNTNPDDFFGTSVAVGSGRIVVGAYQDDDNGADSGSAYIFDLRGNELAKIKASDGTTNDYFGFSVAVGSGRIVVGAWGDDDNGSASGSAYIFNLNGIQLAKIKASDGVTIDFFGQSVAVGSGRIVVGAYGDDDDGTQSGSAYIFDLNGNQLAKIKASDGESSARFGHSVSVGSGRIVVGAYLDDNLDFGAAYVYDLNGNQLAKIVASDPTAEVYFGTSVSVGSGRIVVGTPNDDDNGTQSGSAYIHTTPNQTHMLDLLE